MSHKQEIKDKKREMRRDNLNEKLKPAKTAWKRLQLFANAVALASLVVYAGVNVLPEIRDGHITVTNAVLAFSVVLVGLTAAVLWWKFFSDTEA